MGENVTNNEIYDLLKNILKKSDDIEKEIVANKNELKEEIRNIKTEITQELDELKQENEKIKQENQKLKTRLLTAERRIKKYNLIFYGIKENKNRIEESQVILNLISNNLDLHCEYGDIRDLYRIGQTQEGKIRPVVVEFINYQLKTEILTNSKKLKGSGIFVQNDYTPEDYQERKVLLEHLKKARENDLQAVIKNNVLIVEGEKYTYDELKNHSETSEKKKETAEKIQTGESNTQEPSKGTAQKLKEQEIRSSEEKNKISFKELLNPELKAKKRKEQPTDATNQVKRSARINKINDGR